MKTGPITREEAARMERDFWRAVAREAKKTDDYVKRKRAEREKARKKR